MHILIIYVKLELVKQTHERFNLENTWGFLAVKFVNTKHVVSVDHVTWVLTDHVTWVLADHVTFSNVCKQTHVVWTWGYCSCFDTERVVFKLF